MYMYLYHIGIGLVGVGCIEGLFSHCKGGKFNTHIWGWFAQEGKLSSI